MKTREMLETAIKKTIEQGKKSVRRINDPHWCAYRGTKGLRCAVGQLIQDDFYTKRIEGMSCRDEPVREAIEGSIGRKLRVQEIQYLVAIQKSHDNSRRSHHFSEDFKVSVREFVEGGYLPKYCLKFLL